MALTKADYEGMGASPLRRIAKGKFKGVSSTKSEKTKARLELQRRGLKMTPKKKRKSTWNSSCFPYR